MADEKKTKAPKTDAKKDAGAPRDSAKVAKPKAEKVAAPKKVKVAEPKATPAALSPDMDFPANV